MKIGIQTWGSHGDIRPFLALAEGLQTAGHDVTLVITSVDSARYDTSLSQAGVRIRNVCSPVIQDKGKLKELDRRIFGEADPAKQLQEIVETLLLPAESEMYQAARQLCAENDLLIGHFFHYPLNAAVELSNRPYVSVQLVHSVIPSAFQSPAGTPDLGTFGNTLMWKLVRLVLNKKIRKYSDWLRMQHGIPPARDLIDDVWASKQLTLVAVSQQICRRHSDWPNNYQVCGFLDTGADLEGSAPEELLAFASQGDSPVYMTFGSLMAGVDQTKNVNLLREAAEKATVRAIIQAPAWRELGFVSSDKIHFVSSVSHSKIFPLCRAIVHHGGAGTVQSALLAGKPSVVVPHTTEQVFWARELERLCVSGKPLLRRKLTPQKLADAIMRITRENEFGEKARKIGLEMKKENGVAAAVRLITERMA